MAAPVEIAFTAIRNDSAVRILKAHELGIYFALVQACILDNVNPLPVNNPQTLIMLSRCTAVQWQRARGPVLNALEKTLPRLVMLYHNKEKTKVKRALSARRTFEGSNSKRHLALMEKRKLKAQAKRVLQDQALTPVILQPTKASLFRPETTDIHARKAIQLAKSDKPGIKRFTD